MCLPVEEGSAAPEVAVEAPHSASDVVVDDELSAPAVGVAVVDDISVSETHFAELSMSETDVAVDDELSDVAVGDELPASDVIADELSVPTDVAVEAELPASAADVAVDELSTSGADVVVEGMLEVEVEPTVPHTSESHVLSTVPASYSQTITPAFQPLAFA